MKMHPHTRWAILSVLPLVAALAMWPIAQHQRQQARAREATRSLKSKIEKLLTDLETPRWAVIQPLINDGANVNVRGYLNSTMLHCAAYTRIDNYENRETEGQAHERVALVRLLLARGANVNALEDDGTTPLMRAAESTKPEVLQVLLAQGAKVNLRRRETVFNAFDNRTALGIATGVLRGINYDAHDDPTRTPQHRHNLALNLRDANRIIALLKAAGARE